MKACVFFLLLWASSLFGESKTYSWTDCPSKDLSTSEMLQFFDEPRGVLRLDRADAFVRRVLGLDTKDLGYTVIHVVRWRDEPDSSKPQSIDKQSWHVYRDGDWSDQDFTERKRIYGAKNVNFIYVHLNRRQDFHYSVTYNIKATKKMPAFLYNLGVLAGQFGVPVVGGGGSAPSAFWGATSFRFDYVPSDLEFTPIYDVLSATCVVPPPPQTVPTGAPPSAGGPGPAPSPQPGSNAFAPEPGASPRPRTDNSSRDRIGQNALPSSTPAAKEQLPRRSNAQPSGGAATGFDPIASPSFEFRRTGAQVSGLNPATFDNEGRYFFDFSIGVPVKKIRDVKFTSTSQDTLTATSTEKQNLFAFFNLYPKPIDTKRNMLVRWPHLVTGAKVGSQPLKQLVLAGGWGPVFANFYAGVLFHTRSLPEGTSCGKIPSSIPSGAKLQNKTCAEFTFGINLPVGALVSATKK